MPSLTLRRILNTLICEATLINKVEEVTNTIILPGIPIYALNPASINHFPILLAEELQILLNIN